MMEVRRWVTETGFLSSTNKVKVEVFQNELVLIGEDFLKVNGSLLAKSEYQTILSNSVHVTHVANTIEYSNLYNDDLRKRFEGHDPDTIATDAKTNTGLELLSNHGVVIRRHD